MRGLIVKGQEKCKLGMYGVNDKVGKALSKCKIVKIYCLSIVMSRSLIEND